MAEHTMETQYEIRPMQKDYLTALKLFADILPEMRFMKFLFSIIVVSLVFEIVVNSYHFVHTMSLHELMQYGPVYLVGYYPLVIILHYWSYGSITSTLEVLDFWDIDMAPPKVRKAMKRRALSTTIFVYVVFGIATAAGLAFSLRQPKDLDYIYVFKLFEQYLPFFGHYIGLTFQGGIFMMGYLALLQTSQGTYVSLHVNNQMTLFGEYLKNVDSYPDDVEEEDLFYNKDCQAEFRRRQCFIVKRLSDFYKLLSAVNNFAGPLIVVYVFAGVVFIIAIILFYVSEKAPTLLDNIRFSLVGLATLLVLFLLVSIGQSFEDGVEDLERFGYALKWYNFDAETKKIFLITMIVGTKERKLQFSDNSRINYKLGLAVLRYSYSVISVVIQLYR